jgi:signal transduction histidine kinase
MKKKIIIALSVFSLLFLLSGAYIIMSIENSTKTLNNLILLHRIEINREQFLIQLKGTQSDLYLRNTRHARSMDAVVNHVQTMTSMVNDCFNCHHTETTVKRLEDLRERIEQYKTGLSRAFTIRANRSRLEVEEDIAFKIGTDLIEEINVITNMTSQRLAERTGAVSKDIAHMKTILYILIFAVPLIALGLAIVFLRGFTGPVDKLLTATRRLKSGELEYRIHGLQDEYGEVAASFNDMASSLREHYLRMQWAEQIVVLSELAGGLAHEIRNPLGGIRASMEVLLADPGTSSENKGIVVKVIDQVKRIEILLKSLFNFARPPKPNLMPVNVNDILDASVSLARKHPFFLSDGLRKIEVIKDFEMDMPEIIADPFQIQQVIMNLLLNAADAIEKEGTITLKTSRDEESRCLRVTIADTGKGIESDVIGKIFLPFFTTKPKGTGLGLAITKRLVEQHGGNIQVDSAASGAVFTFTLPLKLA